MAPSLPVGCRGTGTGVIAEVTSAGAAGRPVTRSRPAPTGFTRCGCRHDQLVPSWWRLIPQEQPLLCETRVIARALWLGPQGTLLASRMALLNSVPAAMRWPTG